MKWWQTTRSWVETATAKTEIANTMVKFHQQHGLLFIFTKWPLLKFGLGTYVRVFNKSQWPAKFAGYFTQTRRLLFFGNYPSLNRVFMCCQWIKKPKLHDVCVLFKHSHFCFRILEMHPRGPDVKVFPESRTFIASLSFPTDSKARGLHYSLVIQVYQHIRIPEILQSLTFVSQDQGAENWSFECISYKKKRF